MTPKEIFLELLKKEGRPERLLDQYEALQMALGDPVSRYLRAGQVRGSRTIDRHSFPGRCAGHHPLSLGGSHGAERYYPMERGGPRTGY